MKTIESIQIIFTNKGVKSKRSYSWLLSRESDWAMDANPFIIFDPDIRRKVEGLTYNGAPVAEQLLRKYPKHGLELYLSPDAPIQAETEAAETNEIDYNDIISKGISEIKMIVDENENIDIDKLIEIEEQNKNRKTLIDYLNGIK